MRFCSKGDLAPAMLFAVSAPAHAGIHTLTVTPTAAQSSRYDEGVASVDSLQKAAAVRVTSLPGSMTAKDKSHVYFIIGMVNASDVPLNFGPDNVTVRISGSKTIALTTYEEVAEAERKKEAREKFRGGLRAFGRALSATNAGTTYNSGIYSGTATGYVGGNLVTAQTNGIYSGTQYDPNAALAAQRQAQEMNTQDRANLEERWAARSSAATSVLRTTTVDPGKAYGGVAMFPIGKDFKKAKGPLDVTIEVNVAGEKHIFLGRLLEAN